MAYFYLKEIIPKMNCINIDKIPLMLYTGWSKIGLNSEMFINPWSFNEGTVLAFFSWISYNLGPTGHINEIERLCFWQFVYQWNKPKTCIFIIKTHPE